MQNLPGDKPYLGEIRPLAGSKIPASWAPCDGRLLSGTEYPKLYDLIGTLYGEEGPNTFRLPDLRSRVVVGAGAGPGLTAYVQGATGGVEEVSLTLQQMPSHQHAAAAGLQAISAAGTRTGSPAGALPATAPADAYALESGEPTMLAGDAVTGRALPAGGGLAHSNIQPVVAVNYMMALDGIDPRTEPGPDIPPQMLPYVGQLLIAGFPQLPRDWVECDGSLLSIEKNPVLYALIGRMYGGDGVTTFGVPDLRSRLPVGGPRHPYGYKGGAESVTLESSQLPIHDHVLEATLRTADSPDNTFPGGNYPAPGAEARYATGEADGQMAEGTAQGVTVFTGGDEPHENRQPYLALRYLISLSGIMPSRP